MPGLTPGVRIRRHGRRDHEVDRGKHRVLCDTPHHATEGSPARTTSACASSTMMRASMGSRS